MFGFIGLDCLCLWICYSCRPDPSRWFCLQLLFWGSLWPPDLFFTLDRVIFHLCSKINSSIIQGLSWASLNCRGTTPTKSCSLVIFFFLEWYRHFHLGIIILSLLPVFLLIYPLRFAFLHGQQKTSNWKEKLSSPPRALEFMSLLISIIIGIEKISGIRSILKHVQLQK